MEDAFEEVAGFGLGGGELGFQLVAEGHQFIHFGDDAVLFGESLFVRGAHRGFERSENLESTIVFRRNLRPHRFHPIWWPCYPTR